MLGPRRFIRVISFVLFMVTLAGSNINGYCVPDNSMSITPTATTGTEINASDENQRNNEVGTKFNAHSHTDITAMSGANTFTIGDNAVGNKTYAVDTDQANNPAIRYNTSVDHWTLSNDGATYLAVAHAETSTGLTSGAMLYGAGGAASGAIVSVGPATDGQVLVGRTGGTPILASVSWQWVETLTTTSGTSVSTSTLPTDSDLFMVTFEDVRGAAGESLSMTTIDNHVAIITATVTAGANANIAAFGTGTASSVNGVLYVPRLASNSKVVMPGSVSYVTTGGAQATLLRCEDTGASDYTTFTWSTTTGFTAGKIHIYKSVPS